MKAVVIALAMAGLSGAAASAAPVTAEQTLIAREEAWSKANIARDVQKLSSIVGDDWTAGDDSGKLMTKASFLDGVKTGKLNVKSVTNHDLHVRIIGNIALVQGMDDEVSAMNGKDTSGTYSWTDVWVLRGGHWVAVASQNTKVKAKGN